MTWFRLICQLQAHSGLDAGHFIPSLELLFYLDMSLVLGILSGTYNISDTAMDILEEDNST